MPRPMIDEDECVGCGICVDACPQEVLEVTRGVVEVVNEESCIACEDCVNNCPNGAIYMEEKHAVVDPSLCENCKMCQYVCMRNVIKEQSVPEYIYKQHEALKNNALDEDIVPAAKENGGDQ